MRQTSTYEIKKEQLRNGFFQYGSGETKILIMGSCRALNLVSYFIHYNETNGNPYTIYSVDPFNHSWDAEDNRVDYEQELLKWEKHDGVRGMLIDVDIFLHEFYTNSGFYNVDKKAEKNIYQMGMSPRYDVCLPNFNDYFILFNDVVSFDVVARKMALQDINVIGKLSKQTIDYIVSVSERSLSKFFSVCNLCDLHGFGKWFSDNYKKKRLFHTYNHVSSAFTYMIYYMVVTQHLDNPDMIDCIDENHFDLFAHDHTKITQYDKDILGITWDEPTVDLKDKLF